MYLHIGNDIILKDENIIGVFDLDNATVVKTSREYLKRAEEEGRVITVTDELPKSFIVYKEEESFKVYISQLASATLHKRFLNNNYQI